MTRADVVASWRSACASRGPARRRPRSPVLTPTRRARCPGDRRVLGRAPPHQPGAHDPARARAAGPGREPDEPRLAAGAHGRYRALGEDDRGHLPVPRHRRLQVARGRRLGARAGTGPCAGARRRRGDRAGRRRRSAATATSTPSSRSSRRGSEYEDLAWGHELYCVGHLIQAAVAWQRALGDDRLLERRDPGRRFGRPRARPAPAAWRSMATPRSRWRSSSCTGSTGERRYLGSRRGSSKRVATGCSGPGASGPPTGRTTPRCATRRPWPATPCASCISTVAPSMSPPSWATRSCSTRSSGAGDDMVATRTYLTGGLGSRHARRGVRRSVRAAARPGAYAETCASIASVMLAWRLLLATGDPAVRRRDRADDLQRSPAGPLARRRRVSSTSTPCSGGPSGSPDRPRSGERQAWFACACCPPNVMRALSSWQQYLATDRRRRDPAPPVRDGRAPRPTVADGTVAARDGDRLSLGRQCARHGDRGARSSRGPCRCGSPAGAAPRSLHEPGGERTQIPSERRVGHGDADLGTPATRLSWTSTCRSVPPCRTRASTRSAAASPSSAGRSSIASRRPTCRLVSSSRTSRSDRRGRPCRSPRADVADRSIGLTVPATRRRGGRADEASEAEPQEATRSRSAPSPTSPGRTDRSMRCASGSRSTDRRPIGRRRQLRGVRRPSPSVRPEPSSAAGVRSAPRGGPVDCRTTSVGSKTVTRGSRDSRGRGQIRSRARRSH